MQYFVNFVLSYCTCYIAKHCAALQQVSVYCSLEYSRKYSDEIHFCVALIIVATSRFLIAFAHVNPLALRICL